MAEASAAEPAAAEASAASSTSLDGSKFDVTMVKNDKPSESTISFGSGPGEFISSLCATYDFQPSPYTTTEEEDGSQTFRIVANSTTQNLVMSWEGTIRGDETEGTITCTKKDGTPVDGYTFTGKRSSP